MSLFAFHVTLSILAYAAFAISFVLSVIFLVQERFLRGHKLAPGHGFQRWEGGRRAAAGLRGLHGPVEPLQRPVQRPAVLHVPSRRTFHLHDVLDIPAPRTTEVVLNARIAEMQRRTRRREDQARR